MLTQRILNQLCGHEHKAQFHASCIRFTFAACIEQKATRTIQNKLYLTIDVQYVIFWASELFCVSHHLYGCWLDIANGSITIEMPQDFFSKRVFSEKTNIVSE